MRENINISELNHYKEELSPPVLEDKFIVNDIISNDVIATGIKANRIHREFYDLIEDGFHEDLFSLIGQNISKFDKQVDKKSYFKTVFTDLLSLEHCEWWSSKNQLVQFIVCFCSFLEKENNGQFLGLLSSVLSRQASSLILSKLIILGNLKEANYFKETSYTDLSKYVRTIRELVFKSDEKGLMFLIECSTNIYFDNNFVLNCCTTSSDLSILLISKYGFNINSVSEGVSFLSRVVATNNLDLYKKLVDKYSENIDFNEGSLYNTITKYSRFEYLSVLLDSNALTSAQVKKIYEIIFSGDLPEKLAYTQIYLKLFQNKRFDYQILNLGQGYFIYGLLSKLGLISKKMGSDNAKSYVHILDDYLNSFSDQYMPDSPDFHVVGAAIHVAQICHTQPTIDALTLVLRKFPNYINKKNPNGFYPLQQVQSGTAIYQILLNNGAKIEEITFNLWGYIKALFAKNKSNSLEVDTIPMLESEKKPLMSLGNLKVRETIREDFSRIQSIIEKEGFDFELKLNCEKLFLLSDKLSIIIEKNPEIDFTTELHFLSQNFNNYLSKSLNAYVKLINSGTNIDPENTRLITLRHVLLLIEQIELMIGNVSSIIEDGINNQLEIRTKFLESKFGTVND